MTWAEFRLRSFAYYRAREREELLVRELAWVTYRAPHENPKTLKKSKQAFWPIGVKQGITDLMRERIKEAQEKYQEEIKKKQNARS